MPQKIKILSRILGFVGVAVFVYFFIQKPSFPTPDKIIVFLLFFFMIFGQALFVLKRLLPFAAILLVYDSFRGVADDLNKSVNYDLAPAADRFIFGELPTQSLQNWLWHGHIAWYDFVLYLPYMLHFVLPVFLAILVWFTNKRHYWHYITGFAIVSFAAFFTFLVFPAAPPWLAAEGGYISDIERITTHVWFALGIEDFPSVYNHISPNPVAAVPSLHAAWAILLLIYTQKFYGRKWAALAALYPFLIIFGTIYQGEHYVFDAALGTIYAVAAYLAAPPVVRFVVRKIKPLILRHRQAKTEAKRRVKASYSSSTKNASKSNR